MYKRIIIVAIATLLFSSRLCAQNTGAGFVLPTIPLSVTCPERWVDGWDKSQVVESKSLYDLTTKPRLYLLDKEHRVLLKNTTPTKVEEYLSAR